jgi:hypothetical protein
MGKDSCTAAAAHCCRTSYGPVEKPAPEPDRAPEEEKEKPVILPTELLTIDDFEYFHTVPFVFHNRKHPLRKQHNDHDPH